MIARRKFITLVGSAAAAWPRGVRGQEPARTGKLGVLHPGQAANVSMRIAAIREGLSRPHIRESPIE